VTTKYFNVKTGLTTGNLLVSESNVTLGSVSNLHISGGNSGYVLRTDGSANLTWVDPATTQSAAPMPIVIDAGNTLTISSNYQGLFGTPITVNGTLTIDGALIDVSGQGAPGSNAQISFNDQGDPAGNNGFTFNKTTGNVAIPGNLQVTGNILPASDELYNLGNNTRRFKDLYLAGNTLYLGNATITSSGTGISTTGNIQSGNVITDAAYGSNNNGDPIIIIKAANAANALTFNPNESDNFTYLHANGLASFPGNIEATGLRGSNHNGDPIIIIRNSSYGNALTINPNSQANLTVFYANGLVAFPGNITATSSTLTGLTVVGNIATGNLSASANITCVSLTQTSSISLKENINPITNALEKIQQLVGVTYDRKDGSKKNEAGLVAEDVEKILPNLISYDDQGKPLGIQYLNLTAYLIEAVKDLTEKIKRLENKQDTG